MTFSVSYDIIAVDKFSEIGEKVIAISEKMDRAVRKLPATNERVAASVQKMERATEKLNRENKVATRSTAKQIDHSKRMEIAKEKLARADRRLITAKKKLILLQKQETAAMERSRREVLQNSRAISGSLATVGTTLTTRVALPMIAAGAAAVKFSNDMNEGMAAVATLIPGQTARIQELKTQLQDLAIETGTATGDLTEGAYAAISAWGDSGETIDRLRVVAKAAKAGLASTSETLGLLSSMTEIYGDNSAKAAERTADLAFVTNKLAIKAPFAEMASSMGRVAPLAKQIGISQERLFSTLASSAGVTGSVSEVSTQMASLYTSVIKETPAMERVVTAVNKKMGKSYGSAAEAMMKMGDLQFLRAVQRNTDGTKGFTDALGGRKEGLVLALSMINSRSEKYNEVMGEMLSTTGQTQVAFDAVTKGVNKSGEKWKQTKQRMVVFAQRAGDTLLPVAEKVMDRIEGATQWLGKMDPKMMEAGASVAFLALKIGLASTALSKILKLKSGMDAFFLSAAGKASLATTKVQGFKGVMSNLGPVLASFMAGWAIGDALNEFLIFPLEEAATKLETTVGNMIYRLDAQIDKLNRKELKAEEKKLRAELDKMQGAGASFGSIFSGDFGASFRAQRRELAEKLGEVRGRIDHKNTIADSSTYLGANEAELQNMARDLADTNQLRDLIGTGRGGGGMFTNLEGQQTQKIIVELNGPKDTVKSVKTESDQNVNVELGGNLRPDG